MTNEKVMQLIREAHEKNLTKLDLYGNQLTQLPPEIGELKHLTCLDLSHNQLTQLSPEIGELKHLTYLDLSNNRFSQLSPEIGEFENLKELYLSDNDLTQFPPEIGELKHLTHLYLSNNKLNRLPPKIGQLKDLTCLDLSHNQLTQLSPEIRELKHLTYLDLSNNKFSQLSPEIGEFENLKELYLSDNDLTQLSPEIGKLKHLTCLDLSHNQLNQLPPEIKELKNIQRLSLFGNPLTSPPQEIVLLGKEAIFTYLKLPKNTENNEAKLILVGNGEVGKTCLANRLITDKFVEDNITEGINISKWVIPAPGSGKSEIKLNIWDFGGQEIYHATHQFFLTTRSVYLLVWNARKTKDYDHIYYWLHTIEAFGGDSPIILVMSKMNESDDDLNLRDLRNKFPQIVGYQKVDSKDGTGIDALKEKIRETAWSLPLMKVCWVDSWYKVREKLEGLRDNWITYEEFYNICSSEGLDDENISTLDGYLHELGVILHFKDRLTLKNIVILKPEWATGAFYKILSTTSVLQREGVLLHNELDQIWDKQMYPPSVYPQLMELMNKFELSYELPDINNYLVAELLPKSAPDNFDWNEKDDLCFYYCYDYFLPPGIITRFIVRMHQDIKIKENGLPLCWREGAILELQNTTALVKMKPDEKQIEIRIKGEKKRSILEVICYHLDHINASIKKINVSKQIPCNCSEYCPQRYSYEDLLKAEIANLENLICYKSFKPVSVSSLLDGYRSINDNSEIEPLFLDDKTEKKLYQLLTIDSSTVKQITKILHSKRIKFCQIFLESDSLYLVEAPNELGVLLRNQKGYKLHTFSNNDFISLINYFIDIGAKIKEIEFLGENYFDNFLREELKEQLASPNNYGLIETIKEQSLNVSKFEAEKVKGYVFYRSGLVYSNESLENLSKLLQVPLRNLNVRS